MITPPAATRAVTVLELRSVKGTGGGPEKTILAGAAATDPARALVTVCYLRDERDEVFRIDERAAALGVDYVEIRERHSFDRTVLPRLQQLACDRRIDVIHSHDYKTDLLAWLVARKTGVRIVSSVHGWTGHTPRERLVYYPAHKRLLARFPLALAVSSEIRDELLRVGARPERVRLLLNGIDHQRFRRDRSREAAARARFGVAPGDIAVGSVGRLEPQKRFDRLLECCRDLRRELPALRLLIAGDGGLRSELQASIDASGDAGWARLVGHVDDIASFHHALDLFVQSSGYEGTPNVVLEAMALETPVVATSVGGTAEICRAGLDGAIVPADDRAALVGAIRSALADADSREARVRSARRRVETELSFVARVRALEDIYEGLVR